MRTYLNKKERNDIVMFMCVFGHCDEVFAKKWFNRDMTTKNEQQYLKTAMTYMRKFMDSLEDRLDKDFRTRLMVDVKSTDIFCLPKTEAAIKQRLFEENEKKLIEENKAYEVLDLAQYALHCCNPCQCKEDSYKECSLRKILMNLQVEAFDLEANEHCQYKISEVSNEAGIN